jgi:hypothetical protein
MADEKFTWPCPGKPEELKGQPIGMYHCEYCGEMQIAGMEHLPPQFPSQWQEPFPKVEEPKLVDVPTLVGLLGQAAKRKDSELVRAHLNLLLDHDPVAQKVVWDALHESPEDDNARFILEHVNIDRDDNDNWIVSMKGEW